MSEPRANQAFLDTLPEPLRGDPSLLDVPDTGTLAQRFVETKRLVGMDKIVLPKEPNDPAWSETWGRLGWPKEAKDYKLPKVEELLGADVPEGFGISDEGMKAFLEHAHKTRQPQSVVQANYEFFVKTQAAAYKRMIAENQEAGAAAEKALREQFGTDYDKQIARANKIFAKFGGDKEAAERLAARFGKDPEVLTLLSRISAKMGNDVLGDGDGGGGMTKPQIQAEIAKLEDLNGAWGKKDHPEHAAVMTRLGELYAALQS